MHANAKMNASAPTEPTSAWPMWDPGVDQVGDGRDVGIGEKDHVRLQEAFRGTPPAATAENPGC
jgi:hypothetical protein